MTPWRDQQISVVSWLMIIILISSKLIIFGQSLSAKESKNSVMIMIICVKLSWLILTSVMMHEILKMILFKKCMLRFKGHWCKMLNHCLWCIDQCNMNLQVQRSLEVVQVFIIISCLGLWSNPDCSNACMLLHEDNMMLTPLHL